MDEKIEHTPIPWCVDKYANIWSAQDDITARIAWGSNRKDSLFIVQAVNNFESTKRHNKSCFSSTM